MNEYKDELGSQNFASDSYTPYDLEERLVKFAVAIIDFTSKLPKGRISDYYTDQLVRSASLYNNATENDFVLKEANELVCIFVSSIKTIESKKF